MIYENVQNTWQCYKPHHESHGKLDTGISNRGTNVAEMNIQSSIFQRDSFLTPLCFYCYVATELYTGTDG